MKEILSILTIMIVAGSAFIARPTTEATQFFKLDRPADVSKADVVEVPAQNSKALKTAENAPEPTPPPPVPVEPAPTPVVVEPPAAPAPVAAPSGGNCDLAYNYSWPARTARAICMAESSGNSNNVNWNDNHGKCVGSFSLMQVACFWYPYYGYSSADYYNASVNMDIAFKIWERQGGFGAWTTYTSGKYQRFY